MIAAAPTIANIDSDAPPAEVSKRNGNGVSADRAQGLRREGTRVARLQKAQSRYLHFRRDWGSWSGRTIGQVGITAIFVCQKVNWCDLSRRMSTEDECRGADASKMWKIMACWEGMSTELSRTMVRSRHTPSGSGEGVSINGLVLFSHLPAKSELVKFSPKLERKCLVGGPVRDGHPHAFDCTTSARPRKTEKLLAQWGNATLGWAANSGIIGGRRGKR